MQTDRHTQRERERERERERLTWARCRRPAAWRRPVRTRDCWRLWSYWRRRRRPSCPLCATRTDWTDWRGTARRWRRYTQTRRTSTPAPHATRIPQQLYEERSNSVTGGIAVHPTLRFVFARWQHTTNGLAVWLGVRRPKSPIPLECKKPPTNTMCH